MEAVFQISLIGILSRRPWSKDPVHSFGNDQWNNRREGEVRHNGMKPMKHTLPSKLPLCASGKLF